MRRFITIIAIIAATFALVACDEGTSDTKTQTIAEKSLTAHQSTQQWRVTVSDDAIEDPAVIVVSAPIDIDWVIVADAMGLNPDSDPHTWQKDHERKVVQAAKLDIPWDQPTNPNPFTTRVRLTLTDVQSGVVLASEGIIVQANEPVHAYLETELPKGYDGELTIGVEWLDAEGHDGQLFVDGSMEVARHHFF